MSISLLTLALLGTLSLLGSIVLGYGVPGTSALGYGVPGPSAAMRSHFLVSLLATTLLVAAHTFIMFFLIATGVGSALGALIYIVARPEMRDPPLRPAV